MKKLIVLWWCVCGVAVMAADVNELEFLEAFAWGDREAALKELVPDTEDYFYFHCLHYQLSNDRVAFRRMLGEWLKHNRNRWNSRMREMRRRQALIEFDRNPEGAWQRIRSDAGLGFHHRRRHERSGPEYPSAVRPEVYGHEAFMREARRRGGLLNQLTPRGLEYALEERLDPESRRSWLGRIERPDYPGLVALIAADLRYKDSRGFGHHGVHRLLTRAQLEALGEQMPELLRDGAYVTERLARIPPPRVDLAQDHEAAVAHYGEVWGFVRELGEMHNSLKASTLYRLLDHQRKLGVYDEALFKVYLALPRRLHYVDGDLRKRWDRQRVDWVNFGYRPGRSVVLPPIGNEEPLVRAFLIEALRDDEDFSEYAEFFEARWLREVFAESKILHGAGDPKDWAHLLSPQAYRAILERIELNFAPENPAYIQPGDPVALAVDVKRADRLLVKIYEMQTFNYYTTHQAPVDQAVDLDGMIPTHERRLEVAADPGRRVRHSLELPEIRKRGVYVVELIGNGVSSRALVHVGHLESVSQATAAGQVMMVMNDAGETVKDARVWLNGREFEANEQGLVLLPFSENPGARFVVLRDGDFCSPERIQHLGEDYRFSAGIHVDRQSLNRRSTGKLLLRPDLRLHGIPLNPEGLRDVKVTLAAIDAQGTRTEREYRPSFGRYGEWARDFYVPDGLRRVEVAVEATLTRKTDLEEVTLRDDYSLEVNGGRSGDVLRQVFLTPSLEGWALEVRGLNGERIAGEPLRVNFRHPGFQVTTDTRVTTDERGRVELGRLTGLEGISVSGKDLQLDMPVLGGASALPARLHLRPGEGVSLPYAWDREADLRAVSLFRKWRGVNLEDWGGRVRIADGQLMIEGLEAGEYELTLHEGGSAVTLEVVDGEARSGFILGGTRRLQETSTRLPSIAGVTRGAEEVSVRLRHATASTRVAVRAYRYAGPGGAFPEGQGFAPLSRRTVYPPHVQYVSGREIGDEYRYVLERRLQKIFAGSLLERPGLILNPWELRETEAERERLKGDEAYRGGRQRMNEVARVVEPAEPEGNGQVVLEGRFSGDDVGNRWGNRRFGEGQSGDIGFDFLPEGSVWWVNLEPGEDGTVRVPAGELGEHTALDIVLVDRFGTSRTRRVLPDAGYDPEEVRLDAGLDPGRNFSRQKTVRRIDGAEPVVFPDLATTRYQVVGDFGQAFDILATLNGDETLSEFRFLKDWHEMDDEAKREKYGEYASHELHLFLYMRDRGFFDAVVKPYLAHKKDKTFVDRWLLGALHAEDTRLDRIGDRNALELALLARRGGDGEVMRAALREARELLPPDPEGFARRVRVALQAGDLDEVQSMARREMRDRARETSKMASRLEADGAVDFFGGAAGQRSGRMQRAAAPAPSARPSVSFAREEALMESSDEVMLLEDFEEGGGLAAQAARLYRALPKTKEWAEQNYYGVRAAEDVADRVTVNDFWRDVAAGRVVSPHLLQSHRNVTDTLAALAFCGLPDEAEAAEERPEGAALTLSVAQPAILVTEQILPAETSEDDRPLLLSQQFFRPDDLYRYEGNEKVEKFVSGEFIRRTVYGARVTLTNPTASRRRLNVLMQIPLGAIPLRNGFYTDDHSVLLEPYTTKKVEYFFTFPESGTFVQFPAHAAVNEAVIGSAEPRVFEVKDAPTEVDKTSWAWVSQHADAAETLAFLREHNLRRLELDEMAWRLKDRDFYRRAVALLTSRGLFHDTTFSYGVYHEEPEVARVWLAESSLAGQVGPVFESPLLTVDPLVAKTYEHLEYDPLVNPRAHDVGEKRKILNTALRAQYRSFLGHALYRDELEGSERLALVYYLQVQDRLGEAMDALAAVEPRGVEERLQTDYLRAWMALRNLEADRALALAAPHAEHAVPRWRSRFASVVNAVEEARGAESPMVEDPTRRQDLDRLAAQQPSVELKSVGGKLWLTTHRLETVTLNLYPMDIELLFSRKPFLAEGGQDYAVIKPAWTRELQVKGGGEEEELELPRDYRDRNLMVEVVGKGKQASEAWYANQIKVRMIESYGQVEVRAAKDNRPLPKTYVKVFARGVDGRVSFWKDGYTDLRGRFDYVSLNDREPEEAAEFSILLLHPDHGAEIRQAEPPTR